MTAANLAAEMELTATAVRRHLETLIERGYVAATEEAPFGPRRAAGRGRGRPARFYTITAEGRDAFESNYDDVAVTALRFLRDRFGDEAVAEFARQRAQALVTRYADEIGDQTLAPSERLARLAHVLSEEGFAATAEQGSLGWQIVQHHCPVAHVAEEFPHFCEAEREAFSELLGARVTRLSTMASGGGVCTSVIPTHTLMESLGRLDDRTTEPIQVPTGAAETERNPA